MSIESLEIVTEGLLSTTSSKALLIATNGLIDAGIELGLEFELEVPTDAILTDPLRDAGVGDVGHILAINNPAGEVICDVPVSQTLMINEVSSGLIVNDSGPTSVLCNSTGIKTVLVNNAPQRTVIETVD